MNSIVSLFLRAKHWQMFLLLFGVFFVGQVAIMMSIPATTPNFNNFGQISVLFASMMLTFEVCFLGWFWAMGSFLSSVVEPQLRLKTGFFHFALIYVALYMPVFIAVFQSNNPKVLAMILPLHFFAMYCMFYLLYFASKNLVLSETGKASSFYDYAGPFFLMWFFPVGVWVIQPRINRLYAERTKPQQIDELSAG